MFSLSGKKHVTDGGNSLHLSLKTKGGSIHSADVPFTLKLSGNLATAFKQNSPLDTAGFPTQISVQVQFDTIYLGKTLSVTFKAGRNSATAKT